MVPMEKIQLDLYLNLIQFLGQEKTSIAEEKKVAGLRN